MPLEMREDPPHHLGLGQEPDDARLAPAAGAHLDVHLEGAFLILHLPQRM